MSRAEGAAYSLLIFKPSTEDEVSRLNPTRTGDNEWTWTVRGKRRRPRVVVQPGRDSDHSIRSSRPSEAAGSERTEVSPPAKRAQRRREGHGEGQLDPVEAELRGDDPAPW